MMEMMVLCMFDAIVVIVAVVGVVVDDGDDGVVEIVLINRTIVLTNDSFIVILQ